MPEIFLPDDARWASRAAGRGEIRRLARGLYSTNLDEPVDQLIRRRWYEVAALYFPDAVVVDRSAALAGPAADGSLFLDAGPSTARPRAVELPGLTLRPRRGPGHVDGDMPFAAVWMSSQPRMLLDNVRPSRARTSVPRTLRREELEELLDQIARTRGVAALHELRDEARALARALDAESELAELDRLLAALSGTSDALLVTPAARARQAGRAYDSERLQLFEILRAQLAQQSFPLRPAASDPHRLFAFFEAYFSNWIEGTELELEEAEQIVFEGRIPAQRPADAHDIRGTFDVITDPRLGSTSPADAPELEQYLKEAHRRIMGGRPEIRPGDYKDAANWAGTTRFVAPDLVPGTLQEGFALSRTLPVGMPRAIFGMFLITEVHPFADGNGRVARTLMNAELTAAELCRVMVPLCYRDEYLNALRALTRNLNPRPLWRMIDRAQRWAALMTWQDRNRVLELMRDTNALVDPREAENRNVHLLDPPPRAPSRA